MPSKVGVLGESNTGVGVQGHAFNDTGVLVLLHHKILCRECLALCAEQQGHRGRILTKAAIRRLCMVAIELGM